MLMRKNIIINLNTQLLPFINKDITYHRGKIADIPLGKTFLT
jgi:hypothetical protein